jgi:hypothetical protein
VDFVIFPKDCGVAFCPQDRDPERRMQKNNLEYSKDMMNVNLEGPCVYGKGIPDAHRVF